MSQDYAALSEQHLEAYRLAIREERKRDALKEMRLHRGALEAARAISSYEHERDKS